MLHTLARQAGIDVPQARLVKLNHEFRTFCVQRFDRVAGVRRFYVSALTLLRKEQSEGASYLELAQFLRAAGDAKQVAADLNVDRADHVLNIDDSDNRPSLHTVRATAAFYGLGASEAQAIIEEVACVVDGWRGVAAMNGIARADVEVTAAALAAHDECRAAVHGGD